MPSITLSTINELKIHKGYDLSIPRNALIKNPYLESNSENQKLRNSKIHRFSWVHGTRIEEIDGVNKRKALTLRAKNEKIYWVEKESERENGRKLERFKWENFFVLGSQES